MIVLVPFFGETERFRPLLDRWFEAARAAMPDARPRETFVLLTDSLASVESACRAHDCGAAEFDLAGFEDLMRPGQPFDRKGALVCSFLLEHGYPCLVLDADALLARDPRPALEAFRGCPVAMPIDHGAMMHDRAPDLEAPYLSVKKVCAGVQFFGAVPGRGRLVAGYRRAFEELRALPRLPWSPPLPHLLEQYAWSLAMNRRGGRVLPVSFNWAPHFLGENPSAIVNHHFGRQKWTA